MKHLASRVIVWFTVVMMAFSPSIPLINNSVAKASKLEETDSIPQDADEPTDLAISPSDYLDEWNFSDEEIKKERESKSPNSLYELVLAVLKNDDLTPDTEGITQNPLEGIFKSIFENGGPKIYLNPSDSDTVKSLYCLSKVVPDYENDSGAMAAASHLSPEEILNMRQNRPEEFTRLVKKLKEQDAKNLPDLLISDVPSLSCLLGMETEEVENLITNDPDGKNLEDLKAQIKQRSEVLKIDTRVLKMLNYLVTPKNQGGAGHDRIKVDRLLRGYTLPGHDTDRESAAVLETKKQEAASESTSQSTAGELAGEEKLSTDKLNEVATGSNDQLASGTVISTSSKNPENIGSFVLDYGFLDNDAISAHADGQAVDISEVDNIRCTLIKKRRAGSDKKTPLPLKPIELAWQTTEGYNEDNPTERDSIAGLVNGLYKDGLVDLLNELDLDINNIDDLSAANLGDILEIVGQSLVGQLLGLDGSAKTTGSNLKETLKMVGAVYLADKLKLPRAALYGTGYGNVDDLKANLGRSSVEERLGLPFGSLAGSNAIQIFYNIGERKIESDFDLPMGTLAKDPKVTNEKELMIKVGAALIEDQLHLNRGSFLKGTPAAIREAVGTRKYDLLFSLSEVIDARLNLDDGTADNYYSGKMSVNDFLTLIAFRHLADKAYIFGDSEDCTIPTPGNPSKCPEGKSTTKDSVFGTPTGAVDQLLFGQLDGLIDIGRLQLAKHLTNNHSEIDSLVKWFKEENAKSTSIIPLKIGAVVEVTKDGKKVQQFVEISESRMMALTTFQPGDFYLVFGSPKGASQAVFSHLGASRLYEAIKESPDFIKAKKDFLAKNPEIDRLIKQIEFYQKHYESLEGHLDTIQKELEALKNDDQVKALYANVAKSKEKAAANKSKKSVVDATADAFELKNLIAVIRSDTEKNQKLKSKSNLLLRECDLAFADIQAIVAGEENGLFSDLKFNDYLLKSGWDGSQNGKDALSITKTIWLLLAGKATVEDALLLLGGGKIENELNLPSNTFYYFVKNIESKDRKTDETKSPADLFAGISGFDPTIWGDYPLEKTTADNDGDRDRGSDRERFLASLGQAAIEEVADFDGNTFQGDLPPDPGSKETIDNVISHLAKGSSVAEAKKTIASGLGTSVSLDLLIAGDTAAWSRAKSKIDAFDQKLRLSAGTTQSFIGKVKTLNNSGSYLSNDELDLLSARLNIPKPALQKLTKVLAGQENWQSNPFDFRDFNPYLSEAPPASEETCQNPETDYYFYTDLDGTHKFATIELARAYYNDHADKRLDYIGQINLGINQLLGTDYLTSPIKSNLTEYLQDFNVPEGLNDATIKSIAQRSGIPEVTLKRLFTRTSVKGDLFSYLVNVGESVGEYRLRSVLLGNFSIAVGGFKLGATDLFDILDGNGGQTLYKMAGDFVDNQLGLRDGTFQGLLTADNSADRECLIRQAGADWLFKKYGIEGFPLYGNIYAGLGGRKIETALNWPANTFRGEKLLDLVKNVGIFRFVQGFEIPTAGLHMAETVKKLNPEANLESLIKQSDENLLTKIDRANALYSPEDDVGSEIRAAIDDLIGRLIKRLDYLSDPESVLWKYGNAAYQENLDSMIQMDISSGRVSSIYLDAEKVTLPDFQIVTAEREAVESEKLKTEILKLQKRTITLDLTVNVQKGDTQKLLQGKITPDAYRNQISDNQLILLGSTVLADLLGVEPAKVAAAQAAFMVLKNKKGALDAKERLALYEAFSTIFEVNLDEKLKFQDGTFKRIVMDPSKAGSILIGEGLHRLDMSVFKFCANPKSCPYSTEKIWNARTDGITVNTCDISGGKLHDCQKTALVDNEAMIASAANQLAYYVWDNTHQTIEFGSISRDLLAQFFRSGDMNVLQVLANSLVADQINYWEEQKVKLPGGFQVTWEDIVGAVYGNRDLEDFAAEKAGYSLLVEYDSPEYRSAMRDRDQNGSLDFASYDTYGASGQLSKIASGSKIVNAQNDLSVGPTDQVTADINSFYDDSMPSGYGGFAKKDELITKYLTAPTLEGIAARFPYDKDGNGDGTMDTWTPETQQKIGDTFSLASYTYTARLATYKQSRAVAADRVKSYLLKELGYKYLDATLYKMDKSLPPGFSRAMFEGNAQTRSKALLAWGKNYILNMTDIDPIYKTSLLYLFDATTAGDDTAFDNLVTSGRMETLDKLLIGKFGEMTGINLENGTFTGLFFGLKNGGNFADDIKYTSKTGKTFEFKSIKSIYTEHFISKISGWLDNLIGLKAGTVFKMYSAYSSVRTAESAYRVSVMTYDAARREIDALEKQLGSLPAGSPAEQAVLDKIKNADKTSAAAKVDETAKGKALTAAKVAFWTIVANEIINQLLGETFAQIDASLGLVPGSISMIVGYFVGNAVASYFGAAAANPWIAAAILILTNLFGYYKVEVRCSADGYYPKIGVAPPDSVMDNAHLGPWDGSNQKSNREFYVKAAQYKARRLLGDLLEMPAIFNDQRMTPSQIMTGRKEDVDYWLPKTKEVIYKYTGEPDPQTGELPSRAGLWQTPQAAKMIHVGF